MRELVVYGLGELGQLYGAAALRAGLRVTPITRHVDPNVVLAESAPDLPILIAVGESALPEVLAQLPKERKNALILLQNELFPSQFRGLTTPTVFIPWLLKKRGLPLLVARDTPVYGRFAALIQELHAALDLPSSTLNGEVALQQALVEKYAFIVTINALGVLRDRTLATWLQEDPQRVDALAAETATLGAALCEAAVDKSACLRAVKQGMHALGSIAARGRSAPERVARALREGARLGIALPELSRVASEAR